MKSKSRFWFVVLFVLLIGFVAENVYSQQEFRPPTTRAKINSTPVESVDEALASTNRTANPVPASNSGSEPSASTIGVQYIELVSEVEGTVLLNGSGTGFYQSISNTAIKAANNDVTITINNPLIVSVPVNSSNLAFSVRDAEGNIHSTITRTTTRARTQIGDQTITRITIQRNQTAPAQATRPAVAANDNLSTPNSSNDFEIANSSYGGVKITKYIGTRQNVVIPSTIDGMRVTEIGDNSFTNNPYQDLQPANNLGARRGGANNVRNNKTISGVVLPNTLIRIGVGAFRDQGLSTISFPSSLRIIGHNAFYDNNLTAVVIPNGVTYIDAVAFDRNPIETLVIPQSLANWRDDEAGFTAAFSNSTTLNRVTLPANVHDRNFADQYSYYYLPESLYNAYVGNGKRAGTYVWTGRIWRVE